MALKFEIGEVTLRHILAVAMLAASTLIGSVFAQTGALHMSVVENNRETMLALIEEGADVNARMSGGWTPIMIAAKYGRVQLLRDLLRANARVNLTDNSGNTALILAVMARQAQVVRILAASRANLDHQNEEGMSAFQIAALMDQNDILQILENAQRQAVR